MGRAKARWRRGAPIDASAVAGVRDQAPLDASPIQEPHRRASNDAHAIQRSCRGASSVVWALEQTFTNPSPDACRVRRFGFAAEKAVRKKVEVKLQAVAKAKATRAARGTMGKKQKKRIKG